MIVSPFKMLGELFKRNRSAVMLAVIGVAMIFVGSAECPPLNVFNGDLGDTHLLKTFVSSMILISFGLAGIFLSMYPKGYLSAGVMTLGIVLHFIFFVSFLFADTSEDDELSYIVRLLFYLLLGFCTLFAVKMLIGSTQNTMRVVVVEAAFVVVFLVAYLVEVHHGLKPIDAFNTLSDYHGTIVLMLVSIICLNMSDSKYVNPMKRLRMNVEALETSTVTSNDTYVMRSQLLDLLDPERSNWTVNPSPGVEKELRLIMYNSLRREMILVRKWEGDDTPIVTILPLDLKVHPFKHLNFHIRHIAMIGSKETCARFRMYGDNGFFVDILVRDTHVRKYKDTMDIMDAYSATKRLVGRFRRKKDTGE